MLVHGDCWQGNMLWHGGRFSGFVDWDAAGVGRPGVDLGSIRFDAALYLGGDAPDVVTEGWTMAGGRCVEHLAYWDLLAATSSPTDLASWMSSSRGPGRGDLDVATVTERRDRFIEHPLRRAGR